MRHLPLLLAILLCALPSAAAAQRLGGSVVFQGWGEPAAGAEVLLLDRDAHETVASRTADADGVFHFDPVAPGVYHMQARSGGVLGPLLGPFEVAPGDDTDALLLELPSALLNLGLACVAAVAGDAAGAIVGVAHEGTTGMPLPGAMVAVEWRQNGAAGHATARADERGHFCVGGVPAGVSAAARLTALARVGDAVGGIELAPGELMRLDLALESGIPPSYTEVVATRRVGGSAAAVAGQIVDARTGEPVAGAEVRVEEGQEAVTDAAGRFRIGGVRAGTRLLRVQRLGYRSVESRLDLTAGAEVAVELRLAGEAIALDPLAVVGRATVAAAPAGGALARHAVAGAELAAAAARGMQLHELVRGHFPLNVQEWRDPSGRVHLCIQTRRRDVVRGEGACQSVAIVVDGLVVEDPVSFYRGARLDEYASVEYLQPLEAGIRFGLDGFNGAIVLTSSGGLSRPRR